MPIIIDNESFTTFDSAVNYVKGSKDISNPEAFVKSIESKQNSTSEFQSRISICETITQLQEKVTNGSFSWLPNSIEKLKEIGAKNRGKFILVEGLHPMTTDPLNIGHGAREYSESAVMKATMTAINKKMNINHETSLRPDRIHVITDGDYNEETKTAEYVLYEEDEEILELIRNEFITHVSMQGAPSRPLKKQCDSCGTGKCICKDIIEGLIFGDDKGEAMAYVVTKDGAKYRGVPLQAAPPGDFNTSLTIAETNSVMATAITVKEISGKFTNEKLKEQIEDEDKRKQMLGENLEAFNTALASGDAMSAMQILADEIYKAPPEQIQNTDDAGDLEKKLTEQVDDVKKDVEKKVEESINSVKESIKESLGSIQEQIKEINEKKQEPKQIIIRETNQPETPMSIKEGEQFLISTLHT